MRYKNWRNPEGYTPEEIERWQKRIDNMPDLIDAFRLIREIVAGNSSIIGTLLTQQNHFNNRVERMESATRELITEVVSLSNKIEKLTDLATVLVLEREEADGQT